mmetsp:Transcript_8653/g.14657  ORF Transcript_8653/g.14657 Transcript_8653/m.14657 type:complete len:134 (+) Transcript_8653:138-539(+)
MGSKSKESRCLRNAYGNKRLSNQEYELSYCFEHSPRTCCTNKDVEPIRAKLGQAYKLSQPKISDQCFAHLSRLLCSSCDADVGTGQNKDGAICVGFCDEIFRACADDFFDPYLDPHETIPFCREDSLICSPVS